MTLLIVLGIAAFGIYMVYVTVLKRRNTTREALSSIDVQLRKRHDLIPNIVTLAQKFMTMKKNCRPIWHNAIVCRGRELSRASIK